MTVTVATPTPRLRCSQSPAHAGQAEYLIGAAVRAPPVHNTPAAAVPVGEYVIGLCAGPRRKLHMDPVGRAMLISCGAALVGLRLPVWFTGGRGPSIRGTRTSVPKGIPAGFIISR